MKRIFLYTILVILVVSGHSINAEPLKALTDSLNREVPLLMEEYRVPGIGIAVISRGEIQSVLYFGSADPLLDMPMTEDTRFRVESISKSVSAWGLLSLVERNHLSLNTPVEVYLRDWSIPESPYDTGGITLQALLSNSAGMPLGSFDNEYNPRMPRPEAAQVLSQEAVLIQPPGKGFSYSNTGFNILELVVESQTGKAFPDVMAETILHPLGMEGASYRWTQELDSTLARGHDLAGNRVDTYVYPSLAAGGLFAGVEDIARFVQAGMAPPFHAEFSPLSPEMIHTSQSPWVPITNIYRLVADFYGFGVFGEILADGSRAIWHGGQGHGWMTHFHSIPKSGDGIVILTNSQRSWPTISRILNLWTETSGHSPVKMGRIIHGAGLLGVLTWVLAILACVLLLVVFKGILTGRRSFRPWVGYKAVSRSLAGLVGTTILTGLIWAANQPYLMSTSLFPGRAEQAGLALGALGIGLVCWALLPRVNPDT